MSIAKIQSGDSVKVISGNYKGITGEVSKVVKIVAPNGKIKTRASLTNIPKIAKYRKSSTFQGQKYPGLKTETDRFLDVSNLTLLTSEGVPSKVKIITSETGKKTRVLKKNNQTILYTKLPAIKKSVEESTK
jgi:large subunit ribosomal protein L24